MIGHAPMFDASITDHDGITPDRLGSLYAAASMPSRLRVEVGLDAVLSQKRGFTFARKIYEQSAK